MAVPPNTSPVPVRLRILGPLRVRRGGAEVDAGPRQQRCLLGLLLARPGQPISMSELIDLTWDVDPPATAVNVIHKYVGALRRLLEPGLPPRAVGAYLTRHGNGYHFTTGPEMLDLILFRRLVAEAKRSAGDGARDEALHTYAEALRLGRGPAGDGLAGTTSATATFAAVDREFTDVLLTAADLAVRLGQPSRLLVPLRRAAERDPLDELVQSSLMTTLAAAGRRAEALATYRTTRQRLADELGIEPGSEVREAYRRALGRSRLSSPGGTSPAPPVRPAQLPPDLALFTGREPELAELDRLVAALHDGRRTGPLVIALDGPRETGTSTLAIRFAHRVTDAFADGELYLDLRGDRPDDGGVPVADAVRSILHGLGVRTPDVPSTFDAQVGLYRSLTAGKRFLLLLDNVRDAAQVRPLLPSSARSLVLLTSGRPLLDVAARDGARLLHIGGLDRRAARELLERRLGGLRHENLDGSQIDEIVERCGRSPLALAYLAARLTASPAGQPASPEAMMRASSARERTLTFG